MDFKDFMTCCKKKTEKKLNNELCLLYLAEVQCGAKEHSAERDAHHQLIAPLSPLAPLAPVLPISMS